jgi:hypothetical protein
MNHKNFVKFEFLTPKLPGTRNGKRVPTVYSGNGTENCVPFPLYTVGTLWPFLVPGNYHCWNYSYKFFAPKVPGPGGAWSWKFCQIRIPHPKITINRHPYCWNHSYNFFAPRVPELEGAWSWKFYQIRIPRPEITLNRHPYCWNHSYKFFAPRVPGPGRAWSW